MDPLQAVMEVGTSGMRAQALRLRVISENLANAASTATTPGGDPYRRQTVTFGSVLSRSVGAEVVEVRKIGKDMSPFRLAHDPSHPAADAQGLVKLPNVSPVIEMADMREASRSFEANVNMIENARDMMRRTIELLRG